MGIPWLGFTHNARISSGFNSTNLFYAFNLGCRYARTQDNMSNIWINQNDPPSIWDWSKIDASIQQMQSWGIEPIITLDDYPAFQPGTTGVLSEYASSEPWYLPTPAFQVQYAVAAAQRYDGKTITSVGTPLFVKYMEMQNETDNIHFTPTSIIGSVTLSASIAKGQAINTIAINASSIAAPINSLVALPSSTPPDYCQLTSPLNINDTVLHVSSIISGNPSNTSPFVTLSLHGNGEICNIDQRGIYSSIWSTYNGLYGTSQPHQPQPARDPQFMVDTCRQIYRAVKAVRPDMQIGSPAIWWTQGQNQGGSVQQNPGNHFAFQSGYGSYPKDLAYAIYEYYDYANFHYYSNSNPPQTGGTLTAPFQQALYNIDAALRFNGTSTKPIHLTEIGWQVPTDIDDATRATWFTYCLNVFKQYTQQTGKDNKFLFYTLDANGAGTAQASLITWVSGTTYATTASYAAIQAFSQTNPSLL